MEEITNSPAESESVVTEEAVAEPVVAEEAAVSETVEVAEEAPADEKKPSPFAGIKDQKGLKAKLKYFFEVLKEYPDARQAVLYVLFSMICGAGQMISQFVLQYTLVLVPALKEPFAWFVFTGDTTAEFIGFLAGAVVGNTLTYILNRKKTFNATNNLALSITLYTIMMVLITIFQAAVPGWITKPCYASYAAAHGGVNPTGIVDFLIKLTGTAVGGITALVVSFFGNKFVVMRNWGEGKKKKAEAVSEGEQE